MNEEKMEKIRCEFIKHFYDVIIMNSELNMIDIGYLTSRIAIEMLASARVLGLQTFDSKYDDDLFVYLRERYDNLVKKMSGHGKTEEH